MPPTQVGFLGTGLMGAPMARRLAAAGHAVTVWNRSPEKAAPLAADGMEAAGDPASAVRGASSVVCMLSSGPVCDEVLLGTDGALAAMTPGATLIVMSSIPVETARAEADAARRHGILYLDAPVSGGVAGAAAGTLAIMAGGSSEAFEAAAPLLRAMGRPVHVGGAGAGALAKLANQMIVARPSIRSRTAPPRARSRRRSGSSSPPHPWCTICSPTSCAMATASSTTAR